MTKGNYVTDVSLGIIATKVCVFYQVYVGLELYRSRVWGDLTWRFHDLDDAVSKALFYKRKHFVDRFRSPERPPLSLADTPSVTCSFLGLHEGMFWMEENGKTEQGPTCRGRVY